MIGIVAAAQLAGRRDVLVETLPPPDLPYAVTLAGWVVFCLGLVLVFNAEPSLLLWLVPSVLATFLVQQGATRLAGEVAGTLVAGAALGTFANVVGGRPGRPPRLILLLGGFFVLTVGGVGIRGLTSILATFLVQQGATRLAVGADVVSGLQNLAGFGLQVPTVAVAIAVGLLASDRWRYSAQTSAAAGASPRPQPCWPTRRVDRRPEVSRAGEGPGPVLQNQWALRSNNGQLWMA